MSTAGKVLVVLILLMSLVWLALMGGSISSTVTATRP